MDLLKEESDFGNKDENRIGEKNKSNEGLIMTLIAYRSSLDINIQFENGVIIYNRKYGDFKRGKIKNPYFPSTFGVGYIGKGEHLSRVDGKKTTLYTSWSNMLRRCYDKDYQDKHPTYKGCYVDDSWHNFQNFAAWFTKNQVEGFYLDKDILFEGNKVYSPETCCFVPQEINTSKIYKGAKEINIKRLAEKYKNQITDHVHQALINYKQLNLKKDGKL